MPVIRPEMIQPSAAGITRHSPPCNDAQRSKRGEDEDELTAQGEPVTQRTIVEVERRAHDIDDRKRRATGAVPEAGAIGLEIITRGAGTIAPGITHFDAAIAHGVGVDSAAAAQVGDQVGVITATTLPRLLAGELLQGAGCFPLLQKLAVLQCVAFLTRADRHRGTGTTGDGFISPGVALNAPLDAGHATGNRRAGTARRAAAIVTAAEGFPVGIVVGVVVIIVGNAIAVGVLAAGAVGTACFALGTLDHPLANTGRLGS